MSEEKKLRLVSVKVDGKLLNRVNYYRSVDPNGKMNQADFVIKALEEKCNRTQAIRKGNKFIEIPNLDLRGLTRENEEKILDVLLETLVKIGKIDSSLNLGLEEIMIFVKRHSLMTDEERAEVLSEASDDLEFEEENK